MENAVYWDGRQVGIECAGKIMWFSSAPREAIAAYDTPKTGQANDGDSMAARNLMMTAPFDRWSSRG
ncbi:hypothetical protein LFL96_15045 [Paraburkholderia sp. D15]|uniref:hypothetical protein n=1 Tax=Paraburkholderia sp. D15 TaxID=2880218 RepID=UPI002478585B|nr:hypothetical protein [Paraburkholderia sp. D15]WGS49076.1 hypothetical protein LFL96_15045 [Paraburkholderia sp. D15]